MPSMGQNVRYGDEPNVLVIADSDRAREAATSMALRLGARAIAPASFAEGVACLDGMPSGHAVFVEVDADPGPAFDRLLERLDTDAAALRRPSVVSVPPTLIDAAAAAPQPGVLLLLEASEAMRIAAMGAALASAGRAEPMLREETGAPFQLLQLSEEVGRIARTLAVLSGANGRRSTLPSATPSGEARPPAAATVRAFIRGRRLREQFFSSALFADPAWDMMLDLYAAQLEGRPVAVSSLCIAAAVPPTTALRWMKQLVDEGLFVRIADPRDGRRVFIELSLAAADALAGYFEAVGRIGFGLP